jgi:hypothetical protein
VSGDYSGTVLSGTTLTIEATADSGYEFDQWSDGSTTNPRTITVTEDITLSASFSETQPQPTPVDGYFYIEDVSGSNNTLSIVKSNANAPTIKVYKSTDGTNWTSMGNTSTTAITATVPANSKLYLRATANAWSDENANYNKISVSGNYNVGGNIMSLLRGSNYSNATFNSNNIVALRNLFFTSSQLINAGSLKLPSNVTRSCYLQMFLMLAIY